MQMGNDGESTQVLARDPGHHNFSGEPQSLLSGLVLGEGMQDPVGVNSAPRIQARLVLNGWCIGGGWMDKDRWAAQWKDGWIEYRIDRWNENR